MAKRKAKPKPAVRNDPDDVLARELASELLLQILDLQAVAAPPQKPQRHKPQRAPRLRGPP